MFAAARKQATRIFGQQTENSIEAPPSKHDEFHDNTVERVRYLEAIIGFQWKLRRSTWDERKLIELADYKEEFGNANELTRFSSEQATRKLGP